MRARLAMVLLSLLGLVVTACGPRMSVGSTPTTMSSRAVTVQPFVHVQSLTFMEGVPAAPLYQAHSVVEAVAVLQRLWASSRPYTGTVGASAHVVTQAYWGPSVLTVTTTSHKTVKIYPTSWISKKGRGAVMHYQPNVLTVKTGSRVLYVTNPGLYHWFAGGAWRSQF